MRYGIVRLVTIGFVGLFFESEQGSPKVTKRYWSISSEHSQGRSVIQAYFLTRFSSHERTADPETPALPLLHGRGFDEGEFSDRCEMKMVLFTGKFARKTHLKVISIIVLLLFSRGTSSRDVLEVVPVE